MTGIEAFLEVLAGAGVTHLFGNPGTTELPLNHALARDHRFRYILGVHEVPVVAMADGYALASGQVGVANVHISPGLGNAMGMLYNAHIEGTPLLLTAGQQDRRLRFQEPVLDGDLVRVARPWCKWAAEVQRVEDIPAAVRRAIQTARTPPTGPVFLSIPLDVQLEQANGLDLRPPHLPDRRVRPPVEGLRQAAALLAQATNPAILAGSRVTEADACTELTRVAERLGAPVFAESATMHGRVPLSPAHPLYQGPLPLWSPRIQACLQEFDVVLAVGMGLFRLYIHQEPACPLPAHLRIIHLDSTAWEIGKNYPVELGLLGDPKAGLAELDVLLQEAGVHDRVERIDSWGTRRQADSADLLHRAAEERDQRPMTPVVCATALARAVPAEAALVEEAITTHQNAFERLGVLRDPAAYFAHRGWALGWGLGCALGVKLAWPDRPVLALLGDGAALYGIQALWSAARYGIGVTFVIANNTQYEILRVCGDVLSLPRLREPDCPGMELVRPEVDFVGLARALGVEAHRVADPEELTARVAASLAGNRPVLFEVPVARG